MLAVDRSVIDGDLFQPYLCYVLTNIVPVAIGSFLVAYVEVRFPLLTGVKFCKHKMSMLYSQWPPEVVYR